MTELTGIFKIEAKLKGLAQLEETDLSVHGFKERYDLQEWVANYPQVLGENLLIIGKEFSYFDKTNERVDLLALDGSANLVIIELKRDDTGADVHWQAIKYASYFARTDFEEIIDSYARYIDVTPSEAEHKILGFINQDDLSVLNQNQRIILVSHRFAPEVTSAVLWLLRHKVDIKCVTLVPFSDPATDSFFLQSTTIIPVPGTEGFEISTGRRITTISSDAHAVNNDDITQFMSAVANAADQRLSEDLRPDRRSRWAGTWGDYRYYKVWYSHDPWSNHEFSYMMHIHSLSNGEKSYDIKFEINPNTTPLRGMTDDDLKAINTFMEDYAKLHSLDVYKDPTRWAVEHCLHMKNMDDVIKTEAAKILAEMIEFFTPRIENLVSAHNVQE